MKEKMSVNIEILIFKKRKIEKLKKTENQKILKL